MTEEQLEQIDKWETLNMVDCLTWDGATVWANVGSMRDAIHNLVTEVRRLQSRIIEVEQQAESFYNDLVRASEYTEDD